MKRLLFGWDAGSLCWGEGFRRQWKAAECGCCGHLCLSKTVGQCWMLKTFPDLIIPLLSKPEAKCLWLMKLWLQSLVTLWITARKILCK